MTQYSYTDVDGSSHKESAPIEELETTGIKYIYNFTKNYKFTENKLRKEENLNERLRYYE